MPELSTLHLKHFAAGADAAEPDEVQAMAAELMAARERAESVRSVQISYALDMWMALGCPIAEFEPYLERNRLAGTWANLLGVARDIFRPKCGKPTNGGPCVLSAHTVGRCHAQGDVGSSEPVPHAEARTEVAR